MAIKTNSKFSFSLRASGKNQRTAKRKESHRIASMKYHFCDLVMWS
ncbi:hypothetical protein CPter291_0702 [Collimonas pratensis]|uniref:Uncharacterized protein n=1 Tax=Collimonas pratensis TaxID=279113 RepID=A0ABM5Z1T3_9BURK|nr:hypothetical protein CPter291_0702 [Collimonas pratensis]